MEQLLTKWQAEADALMAEIRSTDWDDVGSIATARKLAKLTQLNACISQLTIAILMEVSTEVSNG